MVEMDESSGALPSVLSTTSCIHDQRFQIFVSHYYILELPMLRVLFTSAGTLPNVHRLWSSPFCLWLPGLLSPSQVATKGYLSHDKEDKIPKIRCNQYHKCIKSRRAPARPMLRPISIEPNTSNASLGCLSYIEGYNCCRSAL